jgi:DNA-3-methyladenine glycosylase
MRPVDTHCASDGYHGSATIDSVHGMSGGHVTSRATRGKLSETLIRRPPSSNSLTRTFYEPDALEVARALLNKLLVRDDRAGRIVEVEAYRGEEDPASHARNGITARNATMFGDSGRLYVYFTYGMHWCANVVCGPKGLARAVLLRAVAPVNGVSAMRDARIAAGGVVRSERDVARGPARLCQAFSIDGADNGADLVSGDRGLVIVDDGVPPPVEPGVSGRVGIKEAVDFPWRFFVTGDPHVSGSS